MNVSPDIIDVQGLWNGQSLTNFIYQKRKPRPYIVTPRGMLDPWSLKRSSRKKGLVSALYERKHLQNATILRATAKMEADHFVACGLRNEMAIVPNGIKIPTKAPDGADKPSRRQLLFLSRVHPKKGIDYLLRAWAKLSSHFPSWDLLIVGPDEVGHTQEMKNYALKLGLSNVFWRGPADDEEKSKLYTSSDLFVLPSHAENFGLVVGEALSYGLPVIVSRNCPWEGVVENSCGWWINLEDSELQNALFEAMSKDRGQLDEMGLRGSRWISNTFSVESVAEQMAGLYEWLLFGGTTPKYVERS
jgi:glycosyltransferase involved in cell wall biosynthesis